MYLQRTLGSIFQKHIWACSPKDKVSFSDISALRTWPYHPHMHSFGNCPLSIDLRSAHRKSRHVGISSALIKNWICQDSSKHFYEILTQTGS